MVVTTKSKRLRFCAIPSRPINFLLYCIVLLCCTASLVNQVQLPYINELMTHRRVLLPETACTGIVFFARTTNRQQRSGYTSSFNLPDNSSFHFFPPFHAVSSLPSSIPTLSHPILESSRSHTRVSAVTEQHKLVGLPAKGGDALKLGR